MPLIAREIASEYHIDMNFYNLGHGTMVVNIEDKRKQQLIRKYLLQSDNTK